MATEEDIKGSMTVLREFAINAAKTDGAPKEVRIAIKSASFLLETLLVDIHRIADAAEEQYRETMRSKRNARD